MKNCIILGSGRSGTSMLSGILFDAGYYMGNDLYEGNDSNPKGFFECRDINGINEELLTGFNDRSRYALIKKILPRLYYCKPRQWQRWLSIINSNKKILNYNSKIDGQIKELIQKEPFCYKDPRFSYTLPVWLKFLKTDTIFLCVFREPSKTVSSILKECSERNYLKDLNITKNRAYNVWYKMYLYILKNYTNIYDNFIFIHYNQILDGQILNKLSDKLEVKLNLSFIDKKLNRSSSYFKDPKHIDKIYKILCNLAGYRVNSDG